MRRGSLREQRVIRANPIFRWTEACDSADQKFTVQALQAELTRMKTRRVEAYFERLRGLQHPNLIIPLEIDSESALGPLIVYPHYPVVSLQRALKETPLQFTNWCRQAGEALEYLHTHMLIHGVVSPSSMVIVDGDLMLTDFGYAPLLALGDEEALRINPDYIAPETRKDYVLTSLSDQFGLASVLTDHKPELKKTEWYVRATSLKPEVRYPSIRVLIAELIVALRERSTQELPVEHATSGSGAQNLPYGEDSRSTNGTVSALPEPIGSPHFGVGEALEKRTVSAPTPVSKTSAEHALPEPIRHLEPPIDSPTIAPSRDLPWVTSRSTFPESITTPTARKQDSAIDQEGTELPAFGNPLSDKVKDANPWQQKAETRAATLVLILGLTTVLTVLLVAIILSLFVKF